jgi:hypothetical protein
MVTRLLVLAFVICAQPLPAVLSAQSPIPYTQGSVWAMNMLRIQSGRGDDYYNDVRASLKRQLDEAKRQGLLLSYKFISTDATNPTDWNMLLMVEYKNMASFDGLREKMDPIASRTVGSPQERRDRAIKRNDLREVIGTKLGREIILRDSLPERANR